MGDGDPKIEGFHGKDDDQMNSKGELLFREIRSGNFTQPNVQRCGEVQVDVPGEFLGNVIHQTWVRRSLFMILSRFPGTNICGPLYSLN